MNAPEIDTHDTPDSMTWDAYFYAWLYWSQTADKWQEEGNEPQAKVARGLAEQYYAVHVLRHKEEER